jgi:TonB family protein
MLRALLVVIISPLVVSALAAQSDPFVAGVYKPSDVRVLPRVLTKVVPAYVGGKVEGPAGQLRVEIVIDAKGSVKAARLAQSLDGNRAYDADTLKAARDWKFVPGRKDSEPVPVLAVVVADFAMRPLSKGPKGDVGLGARVFIEGADDEFVKGAIPLDGSDVLPRLVRSVPPRYPPSALSSRQKGEVLLEVVVLPDGTVGRARVVRSADIDIDAASLTAAKQWIYEPPTKSDQPITLLVVIVMRFATR